MKRNWLAGFALLICFLMAQGVVIAKDDELMSKEDLKALLGRPDVVVIDVRTGGDYKASPLKIQGAIRENPIDVENWNAKYPKEKTIVLYCA